MPRRTRRANPRFGSAALPVLLALACGAQRQADLGDLPLEDGEILRGCRLGYRTFGKLDASRSNAVLYIPWIQGTSRELGRSVGPGRLLDSSRYFVIAVDPLGNGVSTSPSTSPTGAVFPRVSVGDMVEAQHRLVLGVLGIPRLHAVVGVSMGGLEAFRWAAAHPEALGAAVPIVATPASAPAERARWNAAADAVRAVGNVRRAVLEVRRGALLSAVRALRTRAEDYASQARAIADFDLERGRPPGTPWPRLLVVVSERDEAFDPAPAVDFARRTGSELLLLDGRCGHQAPSCERRALKEALDRFLAE